MTEELGAKPQKGPNCPCAAEDELTVAVGDVIAVARGATATGAATEAGGVDGAVVVGA